MLIEDRDPSRYSVKKFHCCVNCGRRFGSQARTCPDGRSSPCNPTNPLAMLPAPLVASYLTSDLEEERRIERQPQVGAGAFHVLRDAVAAAEHPALAGPVGKSHARFPPVVIRVIERAAVAVLAREELGRVRQIEIGLAVIRLDERRRVGPADAQVQRQVAGDLEIVRGEEADAMLQVRPRLRSPSLCPSATPDRAGSRQTARR